LSVVLVQDQFVALSADANTRKDGVASEVPPSSKLGKLITNINRVRSRELLPGEYTFREGFYQSEGRPPSPLPRWSAAHGVIEFASPGSDEATISMRIVQPQIDPARMRPEILLMIDNKLVPSSSISVRGLEGARFSVVAGVRLAPDTPRVSRLRVLSPTFVPAEWEPGSNDGRALGVMVEEFEIAAGVLPLQYVDLLRPQALGIAR